jgi:UDP-2,3-diacylglucosamine pyrophosphatase LpxH
MIIISDVHLRSENCQARLLLKTLGEYEYEIILIDGDLVEDDRASSDNAKMNYHQFLVVEYLRKVIREKIGKKVIRIRGNHDPSGMDFINDLLGIKTLKEYYWEMNGKNFCAVHGDRFDRFVFRNPFLSKAISTLFLFLQKIDTRKRYLTRMIDGLHNKWFRLAEEVADGAKNFALKENIDVIICGHVHKGEHRIFKENGHTIEYWNSGDWTGHNCSFITIDNSGVVELHILPKQEDLFKLKQDQKI